VVLRDGWPGDFRLARPTARRGAGPGVLAVTRALDTIGTVALVALFAVVTVWALIAG
jgi:hypothetical protein